MQITVLATLCHLVTLDPQSAPLTACHNEKLATMDLPLTACGTLMAAVVDWKSKSSRYSGDDWTVAGVRCVLGGGSSDERD